MSFLDHIGERLFPTPSAQRNVISRTSKHFVFEVIFNSSCRIFSLLSGMLASEDSSGLVCNCPAQAVSDGLVVCQPLTADFTVSIYRWPLLSCGSSTVLQPAYCCCCRDCILSIYLIASEVRVIYRGSVSPRGRHCVLESCLCTSVLFFLSLPAVMGRPKRDVLFNRALQRD